MLENTTVGWIPNACGKVHPVVLKERHPLAAEHQSHHLRMAKVPLPGEIAIAVHDPVARQILTWGGVQRPANHACCPRFAQGPGDPPISRHPPARNLRDDSVDTLCKVWSCSHEGRISRRKEGQMEAIAVFTGSRMGSRPVYQALAQSLGTAIAANRLRLIFGGGKVGLMGVCADAALAAGGEVIGVMPEALNERELGHPGLTRLEIVPSMHTRKARMADLADGFIALPGGFGTLEEFFEVLTWSQLGYHGKPCLLLDTADYWQPLLQMADRATEEGFVWPRHRELLLHESDPSVAIERLRDWRPTTPPKWADTAER